MQVNGRICEGADGNVGGWGGGRNKIRLVEDWCKWVLDGQHGLQGTKYLLPSCMMSELH